jgi:acyl-CoA thioester hydrolase
VSRFTWAARVYWEDTDGGGIVYYANYLRFLERARTEWVRSLGHSQQELARSPGILFAVAGLSIEYRRPARLDDELVITCEPRGERAAAMRFAQRIERVPAAPAGDSFADSPLGIPSLAARSRSVVPGGELLVEADVRVVCLDARTLRPKRLPEFLLEALPLERS